jgi:S-formylglutathione hydrolase FrmB
MTLTSLAFLIVLAAVAAVLVAATMLLWNRWPRLLRAPLRLLSLLLVMGMAVVVAADEANRMYDLYESFGDLVGTAPAMARASAGTHRNVVLPASVEHQGETAAARGHGIVVNWPLPGPKSGINREGMVYLPAAYFDRKHPTRSFPVVEAFHGDTGTPNSWFRGLGLAAALDGEITAGRMPPALAVVPKDYGGHAGECENVNRGAQDETYLADDVPGDVTARFRVLAGPAGWATLGFATGGFCAVNLALHHPGQYGAAASLSGPVHAATVSYAASHPQTVALYLFGTARDQATRKDLTDLRGVYRTPGLLTAVLESAGGRTTSTWQRAEPFALDWLGARLGAPVVPGLTEPGAVTLPPLPMTGDEPGTSTLVPYTRPTTPAPPPTTPPATAPTARPTPRPTPPRRTTPPAPHPTTPHPSPSPSRPPIL